MLASKKRGKKRGHGKIRGHSRKIRGHSRFISIPQIIEPPTKPRKTSLRLSSSLAPLAAAADLGQNACMPRTARASLAGFCYHALNRGNGRAQVFHDNADYHDFVRLLRRACARVPMRLICFCLMPNHLLPSCTMSTCLRFCVRSNATRCVPDC
jgi:hypothetical protein